MAHELEIVDGRARMFYSGDTPWHGLGTKVDGLLTAEEALIAGGLNWDVIKVPAWDQLPDGTFYQVPGAFYTRRTEDNKVLGRVAGDYNIIQNREAFEFFDQLVDSGDAKYETAGSLFGGKKIWLTAKIGDNFDVCGEPYAGYLLISTSHDASRAFTAAVTLIRVVCNNTETMAINGAKHKWTLHHKQTLKGKIQEARDTLQMTYKYSGAFEDEVKKMLDVPVNKDQFREIVESKGFLADQKRQKEKNVERLMDIFENEPTINDTDIKGTGWGAFNAVTMWVDHGLEVRSGDARLTKLTEGMGFALRNKTRDRVLALA